MGKRQIFTFVTGIIIGIAITFLYLTYYIDNPTTAVRNYLTSSGMKNYTISDKDSTHSGGGIVYAAKNPSKDEYQLLYTEHEKLKWDVINLGTLAPSQERSGTPFSDDNKQEDWSWAGEWATENSQTKAVVGMTRLIGGQSKMVPFSFEQIGDLPLWIHVYNHRIFMNVYFDGFDSMGNKIWTSYISITKHSTF